MFDYVFILYFHDSVHVEGTFSEPWREQRK